MALTRMVALITAVTIALTITACGRKTPPVMPPQNSSASSTKNMIAY